MFIIRKMKPEDTTTMCEFHTRAIRQVSAPFYQPEAIEAWIEGRTPEGYLKAQAKSESFHVAITQEGKVVGFSGWKNDELCGLYVDPNYHGQGIGSLLLKAAETEAAQTGTPITHLKASLNGQSFYERHGYIKVGINHRISKTGIKIPQIEMKKGA